LLSEIVGEKGIVIGLEIIEELKEFVIKNLNKYNFVKKGIVDIKLKNGCEGLPELTPFDRILV